MSVTVMLDGEETESVVEKIIARFKCQLSKTYLGRGANTVGLLVDRRSLGDG
jgi:hypothetical protein